MPAITIPDEMSAAVLPGDSTAKLTVRRIPSPGHGEVLLRMKCSTICGYDIRCIYHEHLGKGPEGYQPGMIAGHEPCGQIVKAGPGCRRFREGDRAIVYHISGCGVCNDCRRGYMISCTSEKYRRAYGWQRDGGMAGYLLAEEKDLVSLPDSLSYADGAQVACGFGTVYEGLEKIGVSGNDSVLITGLGPVGLAAGALCRKLGARKIIGIDVIDERLKIARDLGLCDEVLKSGPENEAQVRALTGGHGVERAVECSANATARAIALRATRKWGRMVMIGEGGGMSLNPSPDMIHDQKTLYGSWVTSIWRMEELVERLVRKGYAVAVGDEPRNAQLRHLIAEQVALHHRPVLELGHEGGLAGAQARRRKGEQGAAQPARGGAKGREGQEHGAKMF
ncbi:MAG: zinc-binding dehydrogenase [Prevotellaceae bacterium]|jgi:threonine dehydrogenase-like Zn-dependent dehydrogenase|nr:zinc-binding dehydrogenase [Prevotellaceae bacterium]